MKYYQFQYLLQQEGWLNAPYVGVDNNGLIQYLSTDKPQDSATIEYVNGAALPGFQNTHSHAFQYGMAGMAEKHTPGAQDDFWSWREAMYLCALSFSPEQVQAVATTLYKRMLRNGYTHVAEFHYLHHDEQGKPYSNLAEIGERLVAAAQMAGIKITLVPVFYQKGSFNMEPQPRQKRFISHTTADYFKLLESSRQAVAHYKDASLGFGVHSLRAVNAADIRSTFEQGPVDLPFHLHAGEQLKEVDDCLLHWQKRPIEWLLANLPVNERFHIVHCTHMTEAETTQLALSGANAVLCPGTEGNLGDGIFNLTTYAAHGGNWSIGTDSHISLNPLEDLRWLDYTQRLVTHRRNTFADGASVLINKTITAGRKAMQAGTIAADHFTIGASLDAAVYNMAEPLLAQAAPAHLLPAIVYTADPAALLGTLVNGKWIELSA
jgi:formimidoylglutamate deiminase